MTTYARLDNQPWVLVFENDQPHDVAAAITHLMRRMDQRSTFTGADGTTIHVANWSKFAAALVTAELPIDALTLSRVEATLNQLVGPM
jgi:hypothetical protein